MCWLQFDGPILIMNYSNLIHNLKSEMKKILIFLGRPVFEDILECVSKNSADKKLSNDKKINFNPYIELNQGILMIIEKVYKIIFQNISQKYVN